MILGKSDHRYKSYLVNSSVTNKSLYFGPYVFFHFLLLIDSKFSENLRDESNHHPENPNNSCTDWETWGKSRLWFGNQSTTQKGWCFFAGGGGGQKLQVSMFQFSVGHMGFDFCRTEKLFVTVSMGRRLFFVKGVRLCFKCSVLFKQMLEFSYTNWMSLRRRSRLFRPLPMFFHLQMSLEDQKGHPILQGWRATLQVKVLILQCSASSYFAEESDDDLY